jgi:cysteine desulfurase
MLEAEANAWANPSSVHALGREARNLLEDTRELLGKTFRRSPRDVVFVSGGTEANHLALSGARWLVTSRIEHPSVLAQAEKLQQEGALVEYVDVDASGVVTPEALRQVLGTLASREDYPAPEIRDGGINNQNTPLVALMAVNHETGVLQPTAELADVAHSFQARLHVDAVQLVGKGDLARVEAADSLSLSAHKFRGPKGIGALLFECGFVPLPIGRGGAQERGLRPGTVDATAAAGLAAALRRLEPSRLGFASARQLRDVLERVRVDGAQAVVHGQGSERLGHITNFRLPGWKGDELVAALDLEGVCISSGSACSAGSSEPSSVIEAMLGRDAATGAVRVSFGEDSTKADLDELLSALGRLGVLRQ